MHTKGKKHKIGRVSNQQFIMYIKHNRIKQKNSVFSVEFVDFKKTGTDTSGPLATVQISFDKHTEEIFINIPSKGDRL